MFSAVMLHRMSVFHTTCLRRILGVARMDMVPNEELCARAGMPGMAELLSRHRLRWLGHQARMPDGRWAKQLLFAHDVPGGARRVGRPRVGEPAGAAPSQEGSAEGAL